MKRLRIAPLLVGLALAWGCRGTEMSQPGPAAAPADAEAPLESQNADQTGRGQSRPGSAPELQPSWPAGWRLLDAGQAGGRASRVLTWFRLSAGHVPPEEAARQALESIRPLAGAVSAEDSAPSRTTAEVVAHFRGTRLSGVIDARADGESTEVRVTVESSR